MPRHRIPPRRTLAAVAVAALCVALFIVPAALADRTVTFTDPVSAPAQSDSSPIDLGLPVASDGVTVDKLAFRTSKADAKALASVATAQSLRAKHDAAIAGSVRQTERIQAIEELLAQAQDDQSRLRAAIDARLVEQYQAGGDSAFAYVLGGGSVSRLLDRSRQAHDRSDRDARMIDDYSMTVARLEELRGVLAELRDLGADNAQRYSDRADRAEQQLVSATIAKSEEEAANSELETSRTKQKDGKGGTWFVMEGAFQAQLFLPTVPNGNYVGGPRTPRRIASDAEVQAVLHNPNIDLNASGIGDVMTKQIDGRLLDAMLLAAARFGHITITALKSDHPVYTASGNISEHSLGCAMDIGTVGHTYITPSAQTPGSEVEQAVRFFMGLPGTAADPSMPQDLAPHQVISLFSLGGSSLSLPDHGDHIHVGYSC